MKPCKIIRYGLIENRFTLVSILMLGLGLSLAFISSYAYTHPQFKFSNNTKTFTFSGYMVKDIHPVLIEGYGTPLVIPLNISLIIKSTGATNATIHYMNYVTSINLEPKQEYTLYLPLSNPPEVVTCELYGIPEGLMMNVSLNYTVLWCVRSPLFYLSIPALILAISGAVLAVIGYIRYLQRLMEEPL